MRLVGLWAGFSGLLAILIWVSAQSYAAATARHVTYRYIADALSPVTAKDTHVIWHEPADALARPFTDGDRILIGKALSDAWQTLATAQSTARTDILTEVFSGIGLERAQLSVRDATEHGGRIAVLSQNARPIVLHLDGSLFQAEIEMFVARYVADAKGLIHHAVSRDQGVVTLTNEPRGWRVFSFERTATTPVAARPTGWTREQLRGINYYPAKTPWRAFWPVFDAQQTQRDFQRMKGLGANAVRFFISRSDFVRADDAGAALNKLKSLLRIAEVEGLRVIPTLFDMRGAYGPGTWAADFAYLERVLPLLEASPAVSFVDLKNEPDLDFAPHGRGEVESWLRTMSAAARTIAPGLAQTIGWSGAKSAPLLADTLDVISYHDYASANDVQARLRSVQAAVKGKPVLITEIGESSYGFAFGLPGSPAAQADRLADRLAALSQADGVFVWTLYDFEGVDVQAVGTSPWVRRRQALFGLLTSDGAEKPAAVAVRKAFAPAF